MFPIGRWLLTGQWDALNLYFFSVSPHYFCSAPSLNLYFSSLFSSSQAPSPLSPPTHTQINHAPHIPRTQLPAPAHPHQSRRSLGPFRHPLHRHHQPARCSSRGQGMLPRAPHWRRSRYRPDSHFTPHTPQISAIFIFPTVGNSLT